MQPESPQPERRRQVNLRDVAREAGVAVSTVSRVLSERPDVGARTRARVLAVVDELDYRPNLIGQMLRQGSTRTVGFVIGDISNPLLAHIALGAEVALSRRGYSLLLSSSVNDPARELQNIHLLQQRRVDGLLLSTTTEEDPELFTALQGYDGPVVAVDRDLGEVPTASSVCSDHAAGVAAAVRALHDAGHRRICLVVGLEALRPGRERAESASRTAESLGMTCTLLSGRGPAGPSRAEIDRVLTASDRPTGLIAGNNQILEVLLDALRDASLEYPGDVSLVTSDEVPLLRFLTPPIATVRRDPYRLGQAAAELLLERLVPGGAPARAVELATAFETAASIGPPARR